MPPISGLGGLIGLGGGEFRLVVLIGFAARAAVPMNQILSLVTLATALVVPAIALLISVICVREGQKAFGNLINVKTYNQW